MSIDAAPAPLSAFSGYGIEIEYMIVDTATLDVRPVADELLRSEDGDFTGPWHEEMGWSNEPALHVAEIKNNEPSPDLARLAAAFQGEVLSMEEHLAAHGARLMPGSMHPWMDPRSETRLWPHEPAASLYRVYDRIFDCRSHGWSNIQSVHINLPFGDDQEFARLHAAVRLALPLLPALAASSPFADGQYRGFMDYRLEVYRTHQGRIRASMGNIVPEPVSSRAAYQAEIFQPMYAEIAAFDPEGVLRHEWLNARGAVARFDRNAIEIRVVDVQECPLADIAVAAAVIGLVRRFYAALPEADISTLDLLGILLECARHGDQAVISHPAYLSILGLDTAPIPAGRLWADLIDDLAIQGFLGETWLEPLQRMLARGPLARRLLDTLGPTPAPDRLRAVYGELCECLRRGRLFRA